MPSILYIATRGLGGGESTCATRDTIVHTTTRTERNRQTKSPLAHLPTYPSQTTVTGHSATNWGNGCHSKPCLNRSQTLLANQHKRPNRTNPKNRKRHTADAQLTRCQSQLVVSEPHVATPANYGLRSSPRSREPLPLTALAVAAGCTADGAARAERRGPELGCATTGGSRAAGEGGRSASGEAGTNS